MYRSVSTIRRILVCVFGVAVTVCAAAQQAVGQAPRPQTSTSTFDGYSNVRPIYAERRSVGSFQNDMQRAALRGYQSQGRRENRRGGVAPFSLLHDRLAAIRTGAGSTSAVLPGGSVFSPSRAGAFSRLGRAGRASYARPFGTASAAVARRRLLMAGSSRNAPIYRALQRAGGRGMQARKTIATTPFVSAKGVTPESGEPEIDLHEFLQAKAAVARNRIRSDAWEYFRTAEYLRAARAFDTATSLDVSDHTSRMGELFCHVVRRADYTALAVFQEVVRHDRNLFGRRLGGAVAPTPAALFGDRRRAVALQTDARVHADRSRTDPDTRAMYLLILWYLGETSEAQRGAAALAREDPKSPYARWAGEMQRVLDRGRPGS